MIFKDGTDLYWARSRVLEYLSKIQPLLPQGVRTELGPDATGVGLGLPVRARRRLADALARRPAHAARTGTCATACSRSRASPRWPRSAASCSSTRSRSTRTASRPTSLAIMDVAERRPQQQQRGRRPPARVLGQGVHGPRPRLRALARGPRDRSCSRPTRRGTPVLLRDVARSRSGPEMRRGVSDLDGLGDTVGGIVVMRHGENARDVIRARQASACRRSSRRCRQGVRDRHDLRPLGADRARDRHPEARAAAGDR